MYLHCTQAKDTLVCKHNLKYYKRCRIIRVFLPYIGVESSGAEAPSPVFTVTQLEDNFSPYRYINVSQSLCKWPSSSEQFPTCLTIANYIIVSTQLLVWVWKYEFN